MSAAAGLIDDAKRLADALGLSSRDARAEAELLLMRALGIGKARLAAHPELAAEARRNPVYVRYLERRLAGEPVAYILGEREFYGLDFQVTPAVLIPRPETELLVELALERIPEGEPRRVLDIGTGSGCIAVTLARLRPRAQGGRDGHIRARPSRWRGRTPAGMQPRNHRASDVATVSRRCSTERFDVIVSNPPYIAAADPHLRRVIFASSRSRRSHPARTAWAVLRAIIAQAPAQLHAGGWLLLEHGYDQGEAVPALLAAAGLVDVFTARDLAGLPRVSGARVLEPA